jgi:hypothetical protein
MAGMAANEKLIPVFMPSLVSILLHHEQEKGSPLTEQEVFFIRDNATAVMMPESAVIPIVEGRGYDDIDPKYCWEQWSEVRKQFVECDSAQQNDPPSANE